MKRSPFVWLAVSLAAALATPAFADPAPAPSASAAPAGRERLAGRFSYVGGAKEIAVKDAAIEKATESMFFATRGIARSKLRDHTLVRAILSFAFANGTVTIGTSDTPPTVSPDNGTTVDYKNRDGDTMKLSQKLAPDGRLTQSLSTDAGGRVATFVLSADGKTLAVTHVLSSSKLPQPIRYTLTYQRT